MKKRIIASILALVMTLLALASCAGAGFDFAENSGDSEYVKIDLAGFKKAIKEIQIEDADFTSNEDTRLKKVIYDIFQTMTDAAVKEGDKKTEGTLTERDVLYFCYYASVVKDNVTYYIYGDQLATSTITTGTTASKANHVVELAVVANDEDDEYGNALYNALLSAFDTDEDGKFEITLNNGKEGDEAVDILYDVNSTKGTTVKEGDTVVISYTRNKVLPEDATEDDKKNAKEEKVLYTELVLDTDAYEAGSVNAQLVELILGENMNVTVGNDVKLVEKEGETETTVTKFDITDGEATYTYSEIGIEWIVNKAPETPLVTFTHTPYPTTTQNVEPIGLHTSDTKIDLKGLEVTYYVYPVNYISVPEINATSIIKDILGSDVATDSVEVFESEEYKNGNDTVKSLVETLVNIWDEKAETINTLKNEAGDKTLKELSEAATKAEADLKAVTSTDSKYSELKEASEAADKAYDDALEYNIDLQIAKIVDASKGSESVADVIYEQYAGKDGVVYNNLKASYETAITDAVGDEVWALIEKYVVVVGYPEEIVEEFATHIYEQYEYDFYNESYSSSSSSSSTSSESNYSHYKGDLEAFLVEVTKASNNDYEAAIEEQAKEYIKPLLQIFALSKAIEDDASLDIVNTMKSYTESDYANGAYKADHSGHDHGEEEAEEEERESYENALADAEYFLVDDEALKAYKDRIGKASYNAYIDNYGETNLRAALQANRLMYYLLCTDIVEGDEEGTTDIVYKTVGEGENATRVISFRTVSYTIKADETDSENE